MEDIDHRQHEACRLAGSGLGDADEIAAVWIGVGSP
jgi:hypothetical protein